MHVCVCFTSLQQRGHLETALHLLSHQELKPMHVCMYAYVSIIFVNINR